MKSIRVEILGRAYALRVAPEDEAATRQIAAFVDERLQQIRQQHPEQSELTVAVIGALAIAEERFAAEEAHDALEDALADTAADLDARLARVLPRARAAKEQHPGRPI